MPEFLTSIRLYSGAFPIVLFVLGTAAFLVIASRRPLRRSLPALLIGAVVGAGLGLLLGWLVSDVWNSFDIGLSFGTKAWVVVGLAAVGAAIPTFWRSTIWRKVVAGVSIPLFVLVAAIGINIDVAEFPTLGEALGVTGLHHLALPTPTKTKPVVAVTESDLATTWTPPAGLKEKGTVGTVVIPATTSHFRARKAIVYLPPAALVANPPRLPVLEMLSGQPGGPSDLLSSGQLVVILDEYAKAHGGLAPIVVIPDQLGAPQLNPMCVDSPLGNSGSYLTVDVPNWIRTHLHVLEGPKFWGIGGFSEGGTCSIQLGAAHPELFGSIFDISGQIAPHRGSIASTIATAFDGSAEKYRQASPLSLLKVGTPFTDTLAIFTIGQNDTRFGPGAATISQAASAAGMDVHFLSSPGTAHDWHTVQYSIRAALPLLYKHWKLE
jgi:enterochelin esterase-like enzyme